MIPIIVFFLLHCSNDEWFHTSHQYVSSWFAAFNCFRSLAKLTLECSWKLEFLPLNWINFQVPPVFFSSVKICIFSLRWGYFDLRVWLTGINFPKTSTVSLKVKRQKVQKQEMESRKSWVLIKEAASCQGFKWEIFLGGFRI